MTISPHASLSQWLEHLASLHPQGQAGIELGLERVQNTAQALGQRPFCPIITVGGTNGKGSTCAYLESIFRAAGYRTGCYTSPHLLHYNERVRIDGQAVSDSAMCAAFARVEAVRQQLLKAPDVDASKRAAAARLSYFEFGSLAAWEVFATAQVDLIILEVGLGGRLDAVNIHDADVAIVTGIALDHTSWLGDTREAIGHEKAGIFRSGRPAICADAAPPQSLLRHAQAIGARLRRLGHDFGYEFDAENRAQWSFWLHDPEQNTTRRCALAFPGLRGSYQLANASAALAAVDALQARLPVAMQAIREGLLNTELPGRFQVLPGKPAVVLDVAHNPQAIMALTENLGKMGFFARTIAVLGMLADKDIASSLRPLQTRIDVWVLCDLPTTRSAGTALLTEIIGAQSADTTAPEIHCCPDPEAAFRLAREIARENDRILVFGSFFTVAGAMQQLAEGK